MKIRFKNANEFYVENDHCLCGKNEILLDIGEYEVDFIEDDENELVNLHFSETEFDGNGPYTARFISKDLFKIISE